MSTNSFRIYFGIFLVLLALGCASRGRPTGGPKDDTPPVIIQANPENYTTNFNAEEIRIYFDEYIKICLLYTSPSPRDQRGSRMPSSA